MRTRSPDLERAVLLLLASASAVVAVTCSGNGTLHVEAAPRPSAPAQPSSPGPSSLSPSSPSSPGTVPAVSAPRAVASSSPPPSSSPGAFELPHFYAALEQLAEGKRQAKVRVLWLGDSHSYADFWPNAVRRPLEKRFGNGGPGFVLVGMEPYRHAGVELKREGSWRHQPSNPASAVHHADGVFGLGGIRTIPRSGDARASIELEPGALSGRAHWTLYYRLTHPGARFTVAVTGSPPVHVNAGSGAPGPVGSSIRRLKLESPAAGKLKLSAPSGEPELFGVVVEGSKPGVVVDTLGINGARAATPLAWDKAAWEAEVAARKPDLVVIAYGTNEVATLLPIAHFRQDFDELLGRVHAAAPGADCLLAGPTDWDEADGRTRPRVIEMDQLERKIAAAHGCAYFSVYDAMGGQGSHRRWEHHSPRLGALDHIHLLPAGYKRIGAAMFDRILRGYSIPARPPRAR